MARKYDKDALLADYHTGIYTQRQLADRHGISPAMVNRITKGLEKKTAELVNKKVEVNQESKQLSEQEVNAVNEAVHFKEQMLNDIQLFSRKAMQKAGDLLDNTDSGSDFKAILDGVDKLSITTGINERHAKPTQVQQNTQNNGEKTITRVFHVVE
jgi:transcriptional regulator with XRE-family HTH domain